MARSNPSANRSSVVASTETNSDPATGSFDTIDPRRLARFLGTLLGLVSLFVAGSLAFGIDLVALAPAYMFTPLIAAIAAAYPAEVSWTALGLRRGRLRWAGIAALAVVPITVGTLAVSLAIPGIGFERTPELVAGVPGGAPVLFGGLFVVGITVNAVFAAGEEIGWRGYLLWELAPLGFWRASAVIGALWGVWHVPVIAAGHNFPSFPLAGSILFVTFCMAAAPLYTYVVCKGKSVLPAVLFHGVFNGIAGAVVISYTVSDSTGLAELVAHPGGAAGLAVAALVVLGIASRGAPRLSRAFAAPSTAVDSANDDQKV